jgi:hypothetical protein
VVLALLWVGLMVVSPSPGEVRRAAREATGKSDIQTRLPGAPSPPVPDTPDSPRAPRHAPEPPPPSIRTPVGGILNGAAYVLLIGIGIGLILLAARWLWIELGDRRRAAPLATAPPPSVPAPIPPGVADALAAEGRWGEAMHALLVSVLEREISPTPPRSFTSREVISRVPAPARGPFGELVRRVEIVHFGGAPAGEADWRRCRELAREAGVLR